MLKRPLWMMIGAGFGVGLSVWTQRTVRHAAARLGVSNLSSEMSAAVGSLSAELHAAVAEGRQTMRQREFELRRQFNVAGPPPAAIEARAIDRSPVRRSAAPGLPGRR